MNRFSKLIAAVTLAVVGASAFAQAPAKTARLAHGLTEGSPYDIGAKKFAELTDKYTSSAIKVRIFPNAQLGVEQATAKDAQLGLLDMTLVAINNASMWYPPLDVTILPFMFRDRAHVNAVVNGPVGEKLFEGYRKASGLRIVSVLEWGDRGIMNSKRAIEKPADLVGLKVRLPKNQVMLDTYSALGATPTAIDWGELYAALQQGVADGLEGPPPGMIDMKFSDFLKYYSYVPVFHGLAVILVNDNWFNKLTPDQQKAVLKAGREAGDFQRQVSAKAHETGLEKFKQLGVKVNVVNDLTPFKKAVEPVMAKYRSVIGEDWITQVQNAK